MRDARLLILLAIGIGVGIGVVSDVRSAVGPVPAPPAVRVLLLDNSLERPIYVPERQWGPYLGDARCDVVHMPGGDSVPPLDDYTHMIISGSTASLVDPPEWAAAEAELVRLAAAQGISILGSCFGHQMLAYALSGVEYVKPAARPEIGWIEVAMAAEDELFEGTPDLWHAFAWHYDEVVDPPSPWRVLGGSADCAVHVMRYGDARVWGLQSHPETRPFAAKLLLLLDLLVFDWGSEEVTAALFQRPRDDRIIREVVERFLGGDS